MPSIASVPGAEIEDRIKKLEMQVLKLSGVMPGGEVEHAAEATNVADIRNAPRSMEGSQDKGDRMRMAIALLRRG